MKKVLFIGAHPDDLEVMAGGTVRRIIEEGGIVHAITLTNGSWKGPKGVEYRNENSAIKEAEEAAKTIGYSVEYLSESTFNIVYKDNIVTTIMVRIEELGIDTIICPWINDLHIDHQITAKMALSASRNIPRVLMGQGNWYIGNKMFSPNIFIDITNTFDYKMRALECYKLEMDRIGEKWRSYHDSLTKYYGFIAGVERAEGFISSKFIY